MSSPDEDEGSVWRAEVDSEYRERAGIVDLPLGSPQSSEGGDKGEGEGKGQGELAGEGGFPHPEGFLAQQHVMQAGGLEQQDCEGQMGSLADFEGGTLACFGTRSLTGIPQGLSEGDTQGVRRSPSQEPCDREASTMWLDPEPAPSGTGVVAYGLEGLQLASGAPFHLREPKGGWAWGSPSKRARCRSKASVSCQHPFEEEPDCSPRPVSKSSDQVSEMRLMRLIISQEQGDQPKPTSPSDTPGHSRTDIREQFLPMPGPCLSSTPRLSSGVERQGVDDLEVPPKKPESMITGKAGVRPIYLPLVAAAGGLPKASPRRKVSKQKTYQWRASEVAPGSFFPSWWQRDSGGLEDPATFPPISDVLLPGRGRRHSLAPFGTKESKPTGTGPKSMAQRRRVSKPVVGEGEDKEQERDGFPERQSLTQGQRLSFPCGHRGPRGTGTVSNRHAQDPAGSEPLALSDEGVLASGPAPSSDLQPPKEPGRPKRLQKPQQEQLPGAEGCPWCCHLQKEISYLKQYCAALQSLIERLLRH